MPACTCADVGAGYGLMSLAAAARGHRVHAFELGPGSLQALEASLEHTGLQHLVQVGGGRRKVVRRVQWGAGGRRCCCSCVQCAECGLR